MSSYATYEEQKVSPQGVVGTILFHLILLLCFYFFTFSLAEKKLEEQGILINFGDSSDGLGEVQPSTDKSVPFEETVPAASQPEESSPPPQPDKKTPAPVSDNKVETVDDAKAPALPVEDIKKEKDTKKEVKKPTKKPTKKPSDKKPTKKPDKPKADKPKTSPTKSEAEADKPASKPEKPKDPEIDKNALFPGGSNNNSSSQGNTSSDSDMGGNMGTVDIPDGNNKGDQSLGMGNSGVGFSLNGRRLLDIPQIKDSSQEVGTVVVKIKVDRSGKVIDAQYTSAGSTTSSSILRKKAVEAAKKARFNDEPNGAEIQTGSITFTFKLQ